MDQQRGKKNKTAEKLKEREPKKIRILSSGWMGLNSVTKIGSHEERTTKRNFVGLNKITSVQKSTI